MLLMTPVLFRLRQTNMSAVKKVWIITGVHVMCMLFNQNGTNWLTYSKPGAQYYSSVDLTCWFLGTFGVHTANMILIDIFWTCLSSLIQQDHFTTSTLKINHQKPLKHIFFSTLTPHIHIFDFQFIQHLQLLLFNARSVKWPQKERGVSGTTSPTSKVHWGGKKGYRG